MTGYLILKHLHVTTAYLTVILFALRLLLDAVGRPEWRQTPLRRVPHVNDTLLLIAAIGLVVVTPWSPFVHGWLAIKILLLVGYIAAGMFAMRQGLGLPLRALATGLALVQVTAIFHLALNKPAIF